MPSPRSSTAGSSWGSASAFSMLPPSVNSALPMVLAEKPHTTFPFFFRTLPVMPGSSTMTFRHFVSRHLSILLSSDHAPAS